MWNSFGHKTSLLNAKIKHGLQLIQDESINSIKNKVDFKLREEVLLQPEVEQTKNVMVFYMIDVKKHLQEHDEIMMNHLNLLILSIHVGYIKVFFQNHTSDKKVFNRLCNLIKLNTPTVVVDIFPNTHDSIYEYIENMDGDSNLYLCFHPYISTPHLKDILFENTILNMDEYKKFAYHFKLNDSTTKYLCMGFVMNSNDTFLNDYFWMLKINEEGLRKNESIFSFDASIKKIKDFETVNFTRVN